MKLPTTKQTQDLLANIGKRRAMLEQLVSSVTKGFTPAMFVWGPPGLGKSHTLTMMLDALAPGGWIHHTAYSTPKALMLSLVSDPLAIHVFEDCEKMMKTDLTASILRAACGAPNDRDRLVTYEAQNLKLRVNFGGAVILVTNQNLAKLNGPMQGVASRFRPIEWNMSLQERCAVIMDLANRSYVKGGVKISAEEAHKVAKRLVKMVGESRMEFDLDIRLYTEHALPAFAQCKQTPGARWEEIMFAKLTGSAKTEAESQQERTRRLEQLAVAISLETSKSAEKIKKWKEMTELGQAIYYRHLKNAKAGK
jgi:hypothetical protein